MSTVIFSELMDVSTNDVIDWFLYYDKEFNRYNGITSDKGVNNFSFNNSFCFTVPNISTAKFKKKSIWFRRPSHDLIDGKIELSALFEYKLGYKITKAIQYNDKIFKEFLVEYSFNRKLGSYNITGLNKPLVLSYANEYGLDIPETIITNSKNKIEFFLEKHGSIINKALHESFSFGSSNYWISNKTIEIKSKDEIPKDIAVSLFQNKIEKIYEIRTFFVNNIFFSACIFSQDNDKTKLDFRNYDFENPNRIVPYKLPKQIEEKISKLMKKLQLNTGSIDLMKSKSGKYVFLEINPVGQYGFIDLPCNYNIDLEIYKFLTYEK